MKLYICRSHEYCTADNFYVLASSSDEALKRITRKYPSYEWHINWTCSNTAKYVFEE